MTPDDKKDYRAWIAVLVISLFVMVAGGERFQAARFIIASFFVIPAAILARASMAGTISDRAIKGATGLSLLALFLGEGIRRLFVDR